MAIKEAGFDIVIIAPEGPYLEKLSQLGYKTIAIQIDNSSKSIFSNFRLIYSYYQLYKQEKPAIILHNAIKPNIYGALVCRQLRIPVISNISGLGAIFMKRGISSALGKFLYRISQKKVNTVFFQNTTDYQLFLSNRLVSDNQSKLIPGSGVDLARFNPSESHRNPQIVKFCFVGRMLGDKGIYEFIEAAKKIKATFPQAEFYILGELYLLNPTAVSKETLDQWIDDKTIVFLGKTDHVERELNQFDCIVLPSYREGLARVLLEASGMAIPIIASDVPGCREVIEDGKNGFLCKVKDAGSLAEQIEKMIYLSIDERKKMGEYGHQKICREFDEKIVIQSYLKAINKAIKKTSSINSLQD